MVRNHLKTHITGVKVAQSPWTCPYGQRENRFSNNVNDIVLDYNPLYKRNIPVMLI